MHVKIADASKIYVVRTPGSLECVNHRRRLQKAFEQSGIDGVSKYMDQYKAKPKTDD